MKTLVIHPYDPSTHFLKEIYEGKDYTVTTGDCSRGELIQMILSHEKIIMMGHGTPDGLLTGPQDGFVIDGAHRLLLASRECVYIWCNADEFVKKFELKGLYTGMIISEDIEANLCCVQCRPGQVETSNHLFAKAMGEAEVTMLAETALDIYKTKDNNVIHFNSGRIYNR